MKIIVRCIQCSFIDDETENFQKMNLMGPLIINDYKDQFQDYICPKCHHIINLMINTISSSNTYD